MIGHLFEAETLPDTSKHYRKHYRSHCRKFIKNQSILT
jgi:CelD/BcsL family acetyltransferase involved in cellulose biosynthesis